MFERLHQKRHIDGVVVGGVIGVPAADCKDVFVFLGESNGFDPVVGFTANNDDSLDSGFLGSKDFGVGIGVVLEVVDVAVGVNKHGWS